MDKQRHGIGHECHVSNSPSITVSPPTHQFVGAQHAHQQHMLFHRPSPYLRRVKLPRLQLSVPPKNCCSFCEFDDDLPSPDELCARVEFIHLKNAQLGQSKNGANETKGNEQQKKAVPTQQRAFLSPSLAERWLRWATICHVELLEE